MTRKDFICFPSFYFLHSDDLHWLLLLSNLLKLPQSIASTIYCGEYMSNLLANEKPHRLNVWLTLADWYTDWLTDWLVGREIPERWVGRAQGVVRHHHHLITTINIIITITILVIKIITFTRSRPQSTTPMTNWLHVISLLTTMISDHEYGIYEEPVAF